MWMTVLFLLLALSVAAIVWVAVSVWLRVRRGAKSAALQEPESGIDELEKP
jgi:type VI protein secretion system component VasK